MIIKLLPDFRELPGQLDAAGLALLKKVANVCVDCGTSASIQCKTCEARLCAECLVTTRLCLSCWLVAE